MINNEIEYKQRLSKLENLMILNPERGSCEFREILWLKFIIKEYEDKYYPISSPDPIEVIKFRLNQENRKNNYLCQFIGHKSDVSRVLNKKKPLTLRMIQNIHKEMRISSEILIQKYELKK